MSLSCSCDDDYPLEAGSWYWEENSKGVSPQEFLARRVKCCSCKGLISTGDLTQKYFRYRVLAEDSVEYKVFGETRAMGHWYECEECNDMRASLEELGFCIPLGDFLGEAVREYNESRKEQE